MTSGHTQTLNKRILLRIANESNITSLPSFRRWSKFAKKKIRQTPYMCPNAGKVPATVLRRQKAEISTAPLYSKLQVRPVTVHRRLKFTFSAAVMILQLKESPPWLLQLFQLKV